MSRARAQTVSACVLSSSGLLSSRIVSGSSKAESKHPESEAARSTARPPADDGDPSDSTPPMASARNASPGRYGPPAATTKIRPFQLAEALARLSAERDPASNQPDPLTGASEE